ncbi:MAG TPA: hypothetical protein DHW63_00880 [Hyphomonadaceae bacterium]|nr:hypothetical protein [Hyphomonadaceae bacterium]
MHELLERLSRGDTRIIEMCREASRSWSEFLDELRPADTATISARLGFFQKHFHKIFESETLGQTMMPWTGFAVLYDTKKGWGENLPRARQLAEAFARSNCSHEVRSEARSAVISYELEPAPQAAAPPKR